MLRRAGLTAPQPTTADEALTVVQGWGLGIDQIESLLPTLTTSLSGMVSRGTHEVSGINQQQRDLEAALSARGREAFMEVLLTVRREPFWNNYLTNHTIYIFPDLTGVNRFRGYTQTATQSDAEGRTQTVYVIHISKDLLEAGQTELVAANLIHEMSHTAYGPNRIGRALQTFTRDLAGLIADHPRIVALRAAATDATAARDVHIARIRQMLYEVTGYGEEEIFVHLQQLTHQPTMTINSTTVGATDFILSQVTTFIGRLLRIGIPQTELNRIFATILRRTRELYDQRINSLPAGSNERRSLELFKQLAVSTFELALSDAQAARRNATP